MVLKDKVGDSFGSRSLTPIDLGSVLYMEQCGTSECDLKLDICFSVNNPSTPSADTMRARRSCP
jgi:hypothetical protein